MPKKVPYLQEEQIERDAASLLAEFALVRGVVIAPPIPIEDIVEKHLKLGIEFDDMHRLLNHPRSGLGLDPGILGAIFFDQRRIVIDEGLDPEENPNKEGRYRFTLAHEGGGHWRLHRHLFAKDPSQVSFFDEPTPASVVCRSSQAKEPVEWQADFYASCLLMPRTMVLEAWRDRFGNSKPRILQRKNRLTVDGIDDPDIRGAIEMFEKNRDEQALESLIKPFAEQFLVSPIAMRIRLEKLGLLHREVPHQRILAAGG